LQVLAQALGGSVGPNPDGNFVLTIEQVTPTQQLQELQQLGPIIEAALEATAVVSSPSADAPEPARAAAAAAAWAAAAAMAGAGAGSSTSSSGSIAAAAGDVLEQLSDLSMSVDAGGSGASTGSNVGSSEQCGSSGCFYLIESHGDQVGTAGQCIQHSLLCVLQQRLAALAPSQLQVLPGVWLLPLALCCRVNPNPKP
jgi:hypothetical protein